MKYLLDTCIISELRKPNPGPSVVEWVQSNDEQHYYLSTLTFGELHKGIEKLPDSARKRNLHDWVEHELRDRFRNRILDVNIKVARIWGTVQAHSEREGKPMPAIDGLIAATGIAYGLTVVTRNTADMESSGVLLFNPWKE
ncbi:MAG: type II toxin-antitoxin system VapC family toxin [bacterium]